MIISWVLRGIITISAKSASYLFIYLPFVSVRKIADETLRFDEGDVLSTNISKINHL